MSYEPVIGLEVHLQLSTATKLFCGCSAAFGGAPNSQTCPVYLGLPGTLPVLNARAFDWGIRVALALDAALASTMKFDRKQYFYPDLPKGYQISQFDQPLAQRGSLEIGVGETAKRIGITRVHMEEDAGKLLHPEQGSVTFVDFNRAGVPLLEIVSEPDLRSAEETHQYLVELKAVLQYLDVSTCNMEEGSLRCDTNISLRPAGATAFGTKVEIKNLNSFRNVKLAVEHEVARQTALLDQGQRIVQETRLWNAKKQVTESMRSKEGASDYRYFPEPDLVPFVVAPDRVEQVRAALPELPRGRRARLAREHGLSVYDAQVLTQDRAMAELFEGAVRAYPKPKPIANWIMGELAAYLNAKGVTLESLKVRPEWLGHLLQLQESGTLSGPLAKQVFAAMLERGMDPRRIVEEGGLQQISDVGQLERIADEVIQEFPKSAEDYAGGKANALMYLVGQGMKRSQGKANPQQMADILKRKLAKVGA